MNNPNSRRVVLDTNQIIAAGSRWLMSAPPCPSTPVQRFVWNVICHHTGLYSSDIAGEYLEKLIDCKHPRERIVEYIGCILGAFELVAVTLKTCLHPPSDPDDTKFILCAVEGKADCLVTDDNHLLVLKDFYERPIIGKKEELEAYLL
jgi:putative PIN family toxin of toxin-antitoxin system